MNLIFRNFDGELVKANKGPLFLSRLLSVFTISELRLGAWHWFTPNVDRKVKVGGNDWGRLERWRCRLPPWASVALIPKVSDIFGHGGKIGENWKWVVLRTPFPPS